MRKINLETWPRLGQFNHFRNWDYPHFSLCANVDLSVFYPFIKQKGENFSAAVAYVITRVANGIPEFRQRIRGGEVVEHEVVHPSLTILVHGDLFAFCLVEYAGEFPIFARRAALKFEEVRQNPSLEDPPDRDDLLFMTSLPWVSFTSFMHPIDLSPANSIPRFAWGKYFREGETIKMPLNVQAHHALMDGIHMGWFYEKVQECLDHPEGFLG